jgi:hypothetical protein
MARKQPKYQLGDETRTIQDDLRSMDLSTQDEWRMYDDSLPMYNSVPDFIPDPTEIGPPTEAQWNYMNQMNEWQNNIRSTMRPGPVGMRKEGGEILNSFKSAARFDQKSYKKNPGRRNKG